VAPVLFIAGFLGSGSSSLADFGWIALKGIALVAAIVVLGRYALGAVFRLAAQTGSRELIMAISLLVLVGFSILTARVGLSAPLGAFLAGLLLSETEYRHQIEIDLSPFKGLLIGLFFIGVGMSVDLALLLQSLPQILAAAAALLAVKAAVLFLAARTFGVAAAVAAEVALLLPQAGEFGFVVLGVAASTRLLPPEAIQFLTATIALTMIATPVLAQVAHRLGKRLEQTTAHASHELPKDDGPVDHVIIGGYGRVGRTVARLLEAENVPYVALDMDANLVAEHRKAGKPVFFGDASRAELLRRAGAKRARAFIVTLDEPAAAEQMIRAVKEYREDAVVLARAVDRASAHKLTKLGAVEVVPETLEASLQLGGRALEVLGASDDAVAHRLASVRDQFEQEIKSEATPQRSA
jgi:CPA2 family monovalent cation:H+ antiporter-2